MLSGQLVLVYGYIHLAVHSTFNHIFHHIRSSRYNTITLRPKGLIVINHSFHPYGLSGIYTEGIPHPDRARSNMIPA